MNICNVKLFLNRGWAPFHLITSWGSCLFAACSVVGTPHLWLPAPFWIWGLVAFPVVFCFLLKLRRWQRVLMPSLRLIKFWLLSIPQTTRGMAPRAVRVLTWIPGREKPFKYGSAGVSHTSTGSLGGKAKRRCFQNRGAPLKTRSSKRRRKITLQEWSPL